jgi:5-methylcytosine-specific restriction endonuclease McrA
MKNCPKCNVEHSKPGIFCSRKCANSRSFSDESKAKKSTANIGKTRRKTPISPEERASNIAKTKAWALNKYLSTPFDQLGPEGKKRRVLEEQDGKCNHCGIDAWNGRPLVLEFEHKDGNNKNNSRDNVECICPNCHSQTTTWRGRNNKREKITDEKMLAALSTHDTPSAALRSLGLADKGGNFKRIRKLLGQ